MGNSRLSQLPAPAAIEETDFEGIFARKKPPSPPYVPKASAKPSPKPSN